MSNMKKMQRTANAEADPLQFIYYVIAGLLVVFAGLMIYTVFFPSQIPISGLEANGHFKGNEDAKIRVVEFSDFECPACYSAFVALKKISQNYSGDVKITYRHFPLMSIHKFAKTAAEASECAADRGKFWEMHDALFENQDDLLLKTLNSISSTLGLDETEFNECVVSGKKSERVLSDYSYALSIGINSTPTIFIDGVKYSNPSYEKLQSIIESKK